MTVIVPMRAALGFAAIVLVSSLAIEARAQDSSPWQRDGHSAVRLLLRIVPKSADRPVTLRADINYAVCEKLCIPVEASAELPFTGVASTEESALFAALDTVPKPANVGDPNPLTIRDIKRDGKASVLVDVASPDGQQVSLFVEGPTPDWALPVPKLSQNAPPGVKRFAFELEGVP